MADGYPPELALRPAPVVDRVAADPATLIGGRHGWWLGVALLVHLAVIIAVKIGQGRSEDMLWMSHIALGLAGLGLAMRSTAMVGAALTAVLGMHVVWLFDLVAWWVTGTFPLGATRYLDGANTATWVATAHHFYLVPLLGVLLYRHGSCPRAALPIALVVYAYALAISRLVLPAASNVNWAFAFLPDAPQAFPRWVNGLTPLAYLGLHALVTTCVFYVPAAGAIRLLTRDRGPKTPS